MHLLNTENVQRHHVGKISMNFLNNTFNYTDNEHHQNNSEANYVNDRSTNLSKRSLEWAAKFWFALTLLGQWILAYYISTHFGGATIEGDLTPFNVKTGDQFGNIATVSHILLAIVAFGFGPLQLIPIIRQKLPKFHRWNGRVYLSLVLVCTFTGFYMMWAKTKLPGGTPMLVALNIMVGLTLLTAFYTLKTALCRQLVSHRQWALRLFMMVSAGWFFRVGLMAWIILNGGPVGFDPETFEGPFIQIMAFAQYLIPLAVLEVYLRAKSSNNVTYQLLMATGLVTLSIIMAIGIFGAAMGMWLTHL